jgi:hypothetical protein
VLLNLQVGDYRDGKKSGMLAVVFPQSQVYYFEPRVWSRTTQTLQLSDGSQIVDAELGANIPVSVSLLDVNSKSFIMTAWHSLSSC